MPVNTHLGIEHFWSQGDFVSHSVAIILAVLSLLSWSVIAHRFITQIRLNTSLDAAVAAFWGASSMEGAVGAIKGKDRSGLFSGLAETAAHAARMHARHQDQSIGAGVSGSEFLTRAMRTYMVHAQARQEAGLTFLASVGSTAPFIGLFGTVWGIYHALVGLSGATQVVLDKVAGPVGEALIMTAAGLFVAIPAVLAYNALNRANRLIHAHLDGFAHDLHGFLTTGSPVHARS